MWSGGICKMLKEYCFVFFPQTAFPWLLVISVLPALRCALRLPTACEALSCQSCSNCSSSNCSPNATSRLLHPPSSPLPTQSYSGRLHCSYKMVPQFFFIMDVYVDLKKNGYIHLKTSLASLLAQSFNTWRLGKPSLTNIAVFHNILPKTMPPPLLFWKSDKILHWERFRAEFFKV